MGFRDRYQQRRLSHTGPESYATLEAMDDYFGQGGENWTQGVYDRPDGTKCLVGAANHVRVSAIDDAKIHLRQAIAEQEGHSSIELFNDTRASFDEIAQVIFRAKQLAMARQQLPAAVVRSPVRQSLPPPQPVAEILPPLPGWNEPPALTYEPAAVVNIPSPVRLALPAPVSQAKPRQRGRKRWSLAEWID